MSRKSKKTSGFVSNIVMLLIVAGFVCVFWPEITDLMPYSTSFTPSYNVGIDQVRHDTLSCICKVAQDLDN